MQARKQRRKTSPDRMQDFRVCKWENLLLDAREYAVLMLGVVCSQSEFASRACKADRLFFAARNTRLVKEKHRDGLSCMIYDPFIGVLSPGTKMNIARCSDLTFRRPRRRCSRYLLRCPSRRHHHWHSQPRSQNPNLTTRSC